MLSTPAVCLQNSLQILPGPSGVHADIGQGLDSSGRSLRIDPIQGPLDVGRSTVLSPAYCEDDHADGKLSAPGQACDWPVSPTWFGDISTGPTPEDHDGMVRSPIVRERDELVRESYTSAVVRSCFQHISQPEDEAPRSSCVEPKLFPTGEIVRREHDISPRVGTETGFCSDDALTNQTRSRLPELASPVEEFSARLDSLPRRTDFDMRKRTALRYRVHIVAEPLAEKTTGGITLWGRDFTASASATVPALQRTGSALFSVHLGIQYRTIHVFTRNIAAVLAIRNPRQQSGQREIRQLYAGVQALQRKGNRVILFWLASAIESDLSKTAKAAAKESTRPSKTPQKKATRAYSTALRIALRSVLQMYGALPNNVGAYSKKIDVALPGKHTVHASYMTGSLGKKPVSWRNYAPAWQDGIVDGTADSDASADGIADDQVCHEYGEAGCTDQPAARPHITYTNTLTDNNPTHPRAIDSRTGFGCHGLWTDMKLRLDPQLWNTLEGLQNIVEGYENLVGPYSMEASGRRLTYPYTNDLLEFKNYRRGKEATFQASPHHQGRVGSDWIMACQRHEAADEQVHTQASSHGRSEAPPPPWKEKDTDDQIVASTPERVILKTPKSSADLQQYK
ncbi:putative transposable element [Colletotrichum incanum]|uniref:Putative transposable element n=1 Tax=Colletotrichum incanum TaxID=1573173 RepID=A0A167C0Q4_COLIC|nr:putative transposable element [Colletotrichum incanum]